MARKPITDMSAWPSLTLEGSLIAPAMVASIDRRQASDQTEEDYRIRKGLTIREEISTAFRVGQSHFDAFAKLQNPSAEATQRFVHAFLAETFGFDDLADADGVVAFLAGGRVPIVVVPPADGKLDRRSPTLSTDRSRSPAFSLQDYLNDRDEALWGLVTNGTVIRLMRDNASLRCREDAVLTAKICAAGQALILTADEAEVSPFSVVVIQNFFTSSNPHDAGLFEKFLGCNSSQDLYPVKRGGSIWHFDHRFDAPSHIKATQRDWVGNERFVPTTEVRNRLLERGWSRDWLLGWRDITNATNERTVVSAFIPLSAADDTLSLLLPDMENAAFSACLLGNLNSLVLDYCAQSKVGGTHIRKNVLAQFPILPPRFYTGSRLGFVTPKVLELSYTSEGLTALARDLGHDGPVFAWDDGRRANLRADLDAFYARAYGLDRDDLRYILDPSDPKGVGYPSETFRVLKEKEIRQLGEYRTRRLVLEAWDRMEADGTFANLGLEVGLAMNTPPPIQKLDVAVLPDGAWIRAVQQPQDAGAALTATRVWVRRTTPGKWTRDRRPARSAPSVPFGNHGRRATDPAWRRDIARRSH
jgi:hypothetical protein